MDELKSVLMDAADLLVDCGFIKPLMSVNLTDRPGIIKAITLHYTIFRAKAELDQLRGGLNTLGVADAMHSYSDLFQPLFTSVGPTKLTPGA